MSSTSASVNVTNPPKVADPTGSCAWLKMPFSARSTLTHILRQLTDDIGTRLAGSTRRVGFNSGSTREVYARAISRL